MTEPKPALHLVPPCVAGALALYEKLTGKKSTPEAIARAQKIWDDFQALEASRLARSAIHPPKEE